MTTRVRNPLIDEMVKEGKDDSSANEGAVPAGGIARNADEVHATQAQDAAHPSVHGEDELRPWTPPANLTAPEPRPGYVQRWIRVAMRGEDDVGNIAQSFQEGWQPRRADTVTGDFTPPTISHGKYAGYIGVHGLILCEMPAETDRQRKAYYRNLTAKQAAAVQTDLQRESNPDMPISQTRKSEVEMGKKTIPNVSPD